MVTMTFIIYKKVGNSEYAYEVTAYWDSQKKMSKQKRRYLGVVIDKKKKIFERKQIKKEFSRQILDFGDAFIINKVIEESGFFSFFKEVFNEYYEDIIALVFFKLCYNSAMMYAKTWYTGNYTRLQYRNADLSSQRISELLDYIGEEILQNLFFKKYLTTFLIPKKGIIIDATSLPNQIKNPMTAWGRNGEEIDMQIRFLLVVDRENLLPLFFRILPGNIVDISTLKTTVEELKTYNISKTFICTDAGYFSEDNIIDLYNKKIDFLMRMPSGRKLYKELIKTETHDLESRKYAVKYGKRGLFIKCKKVKLHNKNIYMYLVEDPTRRGKEIGKLAKAIVEEDAYEDITYDSEFLKTGIMVLISSFEIDRKDIVPTYYVRQTAEMLFGFSKDDLGILPLRVHTERRIHGFLFLQFITLIAFSLLRKRIGNKYTVEEVLLSFRNLKCKMLENELLIYEMTKEQKEIAKAMNIIVTKSSGI